MEARIKWVDGMAFMAETGSGHAFVMDGAPEGGGRNLGPRPMETVLAGTGGCTAYDVVAILQRSGQTVTGCELKRTCRHRPQGVHPHPHALPADWQGSQAFLGGECHQAVPQQVLLGLDHAGEDGRHYPQP